jgi:hypothetical protein
LALDGVVHGVCHLWRAVVTALLSDFDEPIQTGAFFTRLIFKLFE